MDSTKVSVYCADHLRLQAESFKTFLDNNILVDCTIAAEGEYLRAHKLILSACSSYFQILFTQEKERNPIVILKDINYEELKSIIEFVYCGKVKIRPDRLAAFLDAAQYLQIKGLEGVARSNQENPNIEVDAASQACSREEISTSSDKNFQSNNSNGSEECASQFEQTICASNFRNNSVNPAHVQLCNFDSTSSPAVLSYETCPTEERAHVLSSPSVASIISTLPAPASNISQPNFHSSEYIPLIRDPLIKMEPSETMFVEPKREIVRDGSVGKMSVTNDTNEMEAVFVPYEDIRYCDKNDSCIDAEHIEAVLPEPRSEQDALLRNMSVMNEEEEVKSPELQEENQCPGTKAQSSQYSPVQEIAPALGAQPDATHISRLPAPVMDITQRNCESREVLPSFVDVLIKTETSEAMFLEAGAEDIHDASVRNMCITNDRDEMEEENSPSSYEEEQYPGISDPCEGVELSPPGHTVIDSSEMIKDAKTQYTLGVGSLHGGKRAGALDASLGPDYSEDVTGEIATRTLPGRQRTSQPRRRRAQDEYAGTTGADDMSYTFPRREEKSLARPDGGQALCTVKVLGGNVGPHSVDRQCDLCSVAFQSTFALKRHMRKHTGERPYRCEVCSAAFNRKDVLKMHLRKHTGERMYGCKVCSATFSQVWNLKTHMRTHTGERPYACKVCSAAFSEVGTLKTHMRTHTGERPYRCDVCTAAFSKKGDLNSHMRRHTGERPYRCDVCSSVFSDKKDLKIHVRKHTGERPYRCKVCSAVFSQAGTLTTHLRKHTGEGPYVCDVCSAAFSQKGSLNIHMRKHTGERPYRCDVCSAAFSQKGTLNIHMRKHTG